MSTRDREAVIALAGRRIDDDAVSGDSGFTLDRVAVVASRLRTLFQSLHADTLVCSAANGADLTALHVARELGMRRRIVLPFSAARFRDVSVIDRPGGELWGWLFDELVAEARASGNLVVMREDGGSDADAFDAVTVRIVEEAARDAEAPSASEVAGVVVWDGVSRGPGDASAGFAERVRAAGYPLHVVRVGA